MGTGWVRALAPWVRETLDHDYADAQRRGHPVTLLVTETTGALSPTFDRALRALGKHARAGRAPTTHDSTRAPGMASRGPPTGPSLLTIARLSRRPSFSVSQSVSYFTVPPRAHPSTGSQSGSATAPPLPRRSRGRDYHISRRTRHELQAHHGHVALFGV